MKETITVTSKGQVTLPAEVRRKLGIPKTGGILNIHFDERTGEIILTKPVSVRELSAQVSRHIKRGTKPLADIDEFYQQNRKGA
jgi:AbrB family looped-hinge helix DNA binding protein